MNASPNIRLLAHCDQGGRLDGVQFMLHRGHGYIGHTFSDGVSVVDLTDPAHPRFVKFIAAPPDTRSSHLQAHDDLLLVINGASRHTPQSLAATDKDYYARPLADTLANAARNFAAGMRVFDISRPAEPREIGFMPVDGLGLHRIWWAGGRYAYASAHFDGFSDHIMAVIDLNNPAKPELVGRWWLPGMWRGGGETASGPGRQALHHALIAGNHAYGAWRDGGLTVHDVGDPARPRLLAHRNWSPPFGGGTHSPLPLPDRDLLIVGDEATQDNGEDGVKNIWVFDVRVPANPVSIATMPQPTEENFRAKGAKFGPHNLHENRPGSFQSSSLIFATWYNAGVRVFDIADPYRPRQVGYFLPAPPQRMMEPRPNRPKVIQSCDIHVDRRGLLYVTDSNAGLSILEFDGAR